MYVVVAMHITLLVQNVCSCSNAHNVACFVIASSRTVIPVSTPDVSTSTTTQSSMRKHPTTPDFVILNKPVLDLHMTAVNHQVNRPWRVTALPGGEAAVVNAGNLVVKINKAGQTIKQLYSCSCNLFNHIWGLLLLGSNLYVTHKNGTIAEIQPHTGKLLNVYNVSDVGHLNYFGSLWSEPSKVPNTDILLLTDSRKGEVFSYNLTSRHKNVHLRGLSGPRSVSYSFSDNYTSYIVCDTEHNMTNIYNLSWNLLISFGGYGEQHKPHAAIVSYNNTILVSDTFNNRISVFTTDGVFLYHLLTQSDGINRPAALSYYQPYLWVVNNFNKLYRFRFYE